jgi:hypothetical protein
VHAAIVALAPACREYFAPGRWTRHITLGHGYTNAQLAEAIPLALQHLPLTGTLGHAGVEDGTTGEAWPIH